MIARRFVALALLASMPAQAQDDVDELVAGVGVEWGAMLAEVEAVYPGGATNRLDASDFNYEIDDSRPIFGLDRTSGEHVSFGFPTARSRACGLNFRTAQRWLAR